MDQHQTQEAWVYSHDGPIRRRKRGYIPAMDQSDTVSVGIFPRWTIIRRRKQRVCSRDGPIRRGKRGYIPAMDQSDTGIVGIFPPWRATPTWTPPPPPALSPAGTSR
eukprot:7670168-Pyramimonas_sp.AAC.2